MLRRMHRVRCTRCPRDHGEPPLSLALRLPEAALEIPPEAREQRLMLGDESCQLDQRRHFLRGNLVLPVRDSPLRFVWTLWVELERRPFKAALARWTRSGARRPVAVQVASALPGYRPSTLGLAAELVHLQAGLRPLVQLAPGDHPLVQHQEHGISRDELQELAEMLWHDGT
jgi:hypothetical protein